jgi:hypothetical protein
MAPLAESIPLAIPFTLGNCSGRFLGGRFGRCRFRHRHGNLVNPQPSWQISQSFPFSLPAINREQSPAHPSQTTVQAGPHTAV